MIRSGKKTIFMHHTAHTISKSGHLGAYLNADVLFHLLANISKQIKKKCAFLKVYFFFFKSQFLSFMLLFFITGDKNE